MKTTFQPVALKRSTNSLSIDYVMTVKMIEEPNWWDKLLGRQPSSKEVEVFGYGFNWRWLPNLEPCDFSTCEQLKAAHAYLEYQDVEGSQHGPLPD